MLLAVAKFHVGDHARALQLSQQAGKQWSETSTSFSFAQWFYQCASDLFRRGQLALAEQAFMNVIAISADTDHGHARNELGNLYKHQHKLAAAKAAYVDALRIRPTFAVTWNNLGCVNLDEGQAQLAAQHFTKAAHCDPMLECVYTNLASVLGNAGLVVTLGNLANVFREENRLPESIHTFQRLMKLTVPTAQIHAGLAATYYRASRRQEAMLHYTEAIRLQPNFTECHAILGHLYRDIGNLQNSRAYFLTAVRLDSSSAENFNNLACICKDLSSIMEAIEYFGRSLKLDPNNTNVYCNMVHSLQMVCEWTNYEQRMATLVQLIMAQQASRVFPSVHPHHTFLYPISNQARKQIATAHAELAMCNVSQLEKQPYNFDHLLNNPTQRLRVGYVSADFKDHPTAHLMQSIPMFNREHQVIELTCYCLCPNDNSVYRRKIEEGSEHFVDLSDMASVNPK